MPWPRCWLAAEFRKVGVGRQAYAGDCGPCGIYSNLAEVVSGPEFEEFVRASVADAASFGAVISWSMLLASATGRTKRLKALRYACTVRVSSLFQAE